jgi:hypothetical protein
MELTSHERNATPVNLGCIEQLAKQTCQYLEFAEAYRSWPLLMVVHCINTCRTWLETLCIAMPQELSTITARLSPQAV